jgi:hypothetical protein
MMGDGVSSPAIPPRSRVRSARVREERGRVARAEMREVVADGPPEELHAVLDALRAPGLVHLVGDVRLEPQREDLHIEGLAVARAGLARADVDAALLGLADPSTVRPLRAAWHPCGFAQQFAYRAARKINPTGGVTFARGSDCRCTAAPRDPWR